LPARTWTPGGSGACGGGWLGDPGLDPSACQPGDARARDEQRGAGKPDPPDETQAPGGHSALAWSWWLSYLCAAIGGLLYVSQDFDASDSTAYLAGYNAAGTVPSMVAAALALALVLQTSGQQSRRQAALRAVRAA
jgi:hypothetical protein